MTADDLSDFVATTAKPAPVFVFGRKRGMVLAVVWAMVLTLLLMIVPKFEVIFRDFGIEASTFMSLVFGAARLWYLTVPFAVGLVVVNAVVLARLRTRKDGRAKAWAWSWLMFALPVASILSILGVLFLALVGLISRLSG